MSREAFVQSRDKGAVCIGIRTISTAASAINY
jgi:hypothetical protein